MTAYNITIKGEIVLALMKSLQTQGVKKPYGFSVTDMATDVIEVLGDWWQAQDAALLANEARLIAENAELRERIAQTEQFRPLYILNPGEEIKIIGEGAATYKAIMKHNFSKIDAEEI